MDDVTRTEAIEGLAECLYFTMERLDPTGMPPWQDAPEHEREFNRHCVRALLSRRKLILSALRASDNDVKHGGAEPSK